MGGCRARRCSLHRASSKRGAWSRLNAQVGPEHVACRSIESRYLPPQCREVPEPCKVAVPDDQAMAPERAVVRTGPIFAAVLRLSYIKQRVPLTRAQAAMLLEAQRLVSVFLSAPQRVSNHRVRHAPGARASRAYLPRRGSA